MRIENRVRAQVISIFVLSLAIVIILFVTPTYCDTISLTGINGIPEIGKWVLKDNGEPSDWLGVKYETKTLYEPINILIVDPISRSETEAISELENACSRIGYHKRFGHSSGYKAKVGNEIVNEVPKEWRHAFSDQPMWEINNHGRFFGPIILNNSFIFVGSFSQESFKFFAMVHHNLISFKVAVNDFSKKLIASGRYINQGKIMLKNTDIDKKDITTADHDGYVICLFRKK